ncbi:MAG: DUF2231 domain-containing protein [Methylococcales bacterium]|nr:DUF2231 domain-containing protein [Methylococcales bacterium]MCK5926451.1 DUF2231 domain-containing protein [Methylococcales bacterium]
MNALYFLSFQVHGGSGSGGIVAMLDGVLSFIEMLVDNSFADIFIIMMPGITAMSNIHPLVVHFPIAFLISFFVIDLIGTLFRQPHWRTVASGLLYLGTIGVICAVIAGFLAADAVAHDETIHAIIEKHEMLGIASLSLALILSIWRLLAKGMVRGVVNVLHVFLSATLSVLIMLGADLGGLMVYKHGVSVDAVKINQTPAFQEHSHHDHTH